MFCVKIQWNWAHWALEKLCHLLSKHNLHKKESWTTWKSSSGPLAYLAWHILSLLPGILCPPSWHCFTPLVFLLVVKVTWLKVGSFYQGYFLVEPFGTFARLTLLPLGSLESPQLQWNYRMTGPYNGGLFTSVLAGMGHFSRKSDCVNAVT